MLAKIQKFNPPQVKGIKLKQEMKRYGLIPWIEVIGYNALKECVTTFFSLKGLPLQILTSNTNMATMCRPCENVVDSATSFPALYKLSEKFGRSRNEKKPEQPAGIRLVLYHKCSIGLPPGERPQPQPMITLQAFVCQLRKLSRPNADGRV